VLGIVQQSGGSVWLYSELGKGTTIKVFLPSVNLPTDSTELPPPPTTVGGNESILVVEDDEQVRHVTANILRRNGYAVIEAGNAGDALLQAEALSTPIDLLLTDVVMPRMSGPELAKRLRLERPALKVLFMSGYTDDSIVRHGVLEATMSFLQKPITVCSLTLKVREVLDAPSGSAAAHA
jgi:two-component system cell cycle sensor histidine kinase/response regulator CckA